MSPDTLEALLERRRVTAHALADLDAEIQRRLLQPVERPVVRDLERWLSPDEAAATTGVTKRWLLDHAHDIPGVKRLSRKTIRFSEAKLRKFLTGIAA